MRKFGRDLLIAAGGHLLAYTVIIWAMPVSAHLTG